MAKAQSTTKLKTALKKAPKKAALATKLTRKSTKIQYLEKYTTASIVSYLAEKHNLSNKQMKLIIESYYDVMSTGVKNGERVPLEKIGKIYYHVRPAQKARKGRNPRTGEEVDIPAKRAMKVPKFSFSKSFKESILKVRARKS